MENVACPHCHDVAHVNMPPNAEMEKVFKKPKGDVQGTCKHCGEDFGMFVKYLE